MADRRYFTIIDIRSVYSWRYRQIRSDSVNIPSTPDLYPAPAARPGPAHARGPAARAAAVAAGSSADSPPQRSETVHATRAVGWRATGLCYWRGVHVRPEHLREGSGDGTRDSSGLGARGRVPFDFEVCALCFVEIVRAGAGGGGGAGGAMSMTRPDPSPYRLFTALCDPMSMFKFTSRFFWTRNK